MTIREKIRQRFFQCNPRANDATLKPELLKSGKKLWSNTRYFKKELKEMGFDIRSSETPITPVIVGESGVAKKLSSRLFEGGVFALPIVYPMVATDKARIRTIMNAALTRENMDSAVNAFEKIGKELEIIWCFHPNVESISFK